MMHEAGFIPLFSQLGKALRTELPVTDGDYADFAEKPAALIAWVRRTVSRMKVTNGFVLLGKMNARTRRGILMEFGENVGLDLRVACRALHRFP
jgi:hypothetical protein